MTYKLSPHHKAFMYRLIKDLIEVTGIKKRTAIRQLLKLALKFTPGDDNLYLQPIERRIILSWLYRLQDVARNRRETEVLERIEAVITALTCT